MDANRLFTSYKYGWQTDRGMIYIVFGPPEDIQKTYLFEKWYYSLNGQRNALVFTFYRNKNNPFTNSDFILERSDYYKDLWYFAVERIRQGRLSTK
ncbi:MAG: GWxTD domain-containing protein [Bacteroidetes bacterium]|nr:MAG: GWxTD domain-containing protein [Bacteroidota bacterium]